MTRRLVIANRGEIARRIFRTARARGYRVAVVSTPEDRDALVRLEADEVLEVPSFLDGEAIVAVAKKWKADLLHPGYGFLSEDASFAELVEARGIAFVGPTPEAMRALGNKERAKAIAAECGVPTLASVSSSETESLTSKKLGAKLRELGIESPFLVKAAGGGGGRGMRVVQRVEDLPKAMRRASEEALAGFGDRTVFVERFLASPRHVEIQVFGDGGGGGVFLGERECSMQRRYQKVIEEAPSPAVDASLREEMGDAGLRLVERTHYRGAGTVEFLLDAEGRFHFLEVNTRLQVEHPVTEMVFDVDLVGAQLELAEGGWPSELPDPAVREPVAPRRWAIEARVLAEDPRSEFLPTPGLLKRYVEPNGEGVRVDSGVREGGRVHAGFDSMIAKVIARGESRDEAIHRLASALETMIVHGPTTNLTFLHRLVCHPDFRRGEYTTSFIGENLAELNRSRLPEALERRIQTFGFREKLALAARGKASEETGPLAARFRRLGNDVAHVGSPLEERPLEVRPVSPPGRLVLAGEDLRRAVGVDAPHAELTAWLTPLDESHMALTLLGETVRLDVPSAAAHRRTQFAATDGDVRAPMAGKVLEIHVREGDVVEEGQSVVVFESMKIQVEVNAPIDGHVGEIFVTPGQVLDGPELLAVVVPSALED